MSSAAALLDWLAAHGAVLLLGTTVVLAGGVAAAACCRHPAGRRRLGLLAVSGCACYLLAAAVPLPRWTPAREPEPRLPAADAAATPMPVRVVPSPPPAMAGPALAAAGFAEPLPAAAPTARSAPMPVRASRSIPWAHLAAAAWLGAAVLFLFRGLAGVVRLRGALRRSRPGPDHFAAELPPRTSLRITDRAVRPFCAGVFRPVVVLPAALLAPERHREAIAVLHHEAAHLRARDPLVQVLFALAAIALGLHPLFWWLRADVRFQSERLADEAAAAGGRAAYARDLLALAERALPEFAVAGAVPVFHRPSEFYRRIQMLLQTRRPPPPPSMLRTAGQAFAAAAVVAACTCTLGVPAAAQEPTPPPATSPAAQRENDALRAELDALHAEIKRLRDLLAEAGPTGAGSSSVEYTVQEGDTLATIARRFLGDANRAQEFFALNPGLDPARIRPGQKLRLPPNAAPVGTTPEGKVARGTPPYEDLATALRTRVFLPGPDGLPTHAVNLAPAEAPASTTSAEAIADLASRYLDLQAELELAGARVAETRSLAEAGLAQASEARQAALHCATLEKKLGVVRRLVDGEIAATETELAWLEQSRRGAAPTEKLRLEVQLLRARWRLEALRAVR
ncbi:MAG: LysM peptidoglycan-binding domain-containing protein [Planctomycetes bacterium]|nr:LysM peptidoglycan-binding domain-containing protein [Planctomycetota bacterium]